MDKSKLVKFINKYYLSGNVNSVLVLTEMVYLHDLFRVISLCWEKLS